ncbi:hypothetical protein AGJ34_12465 [Cronobacter dublinensis subsp. dublinensis]|nr:hypothetical protein [Cronobacter dublinensis subsp. dublinensis]EGT5669908.1 hypothetical protein [Cronobacter dublinensis subsp. dublinensis]EGT5673809.1 hypothetical protein [Cronobacter dublinensis subsp. dublinensis]EGT5677247.1 hypothetical protein [Cronobacter dublinensis subsp. dublinensis]EGT5686436.1 hypothetical protein [Cronobacter dublinensis subsp. dublinensis]
MWFWSGHKKQTFNSTRKKRQNFKANDYPAFGRGFSTELYGFWQKLTLADEEFSAGCANDIVDAQKSGLRVKAIRVNRQGSPAGRLFQ